MTAEQELLTALQHFFPRCCPRSPPSLSHSPCSTPPPVAGCGMLCNKLLDRHSRPHILRLAVNHDYLFIADICGSFMNFFRCSKCASAMGRGSSIQDGKLTRFPMPSNGSACLLGVREKKRTLHTLRRTRPDLARPKAKGHSNRMPSVDKNRATR